MKPHTPSKLKLVVSLRDFNSFSNSLPFELKKDQRSLHVAQPQHSAPLRKKVCASLYSTGYQYPLRHETRRSFRYRARPSLINFKKFGVTKMSSSTIIISLCLSITWFAASMTFRANPK